MARYSGAVELTWTNKHQSLLSYEDDGYEWVDSADRPRSRPINRFASPACHRSQTSTTSASLNLGTTTTSDKRQHSHRQALHSPPETTALMGEVFSDP